MYDARERAIRDRKWEIDSAVREAKIEGKMETIRILQGLLNLPPGEEQDMQALGLEQLDALVDNLQEKLRNREPS